MSKNPAFQFYPGDWQHDSSLRSCSLAAKGLWIEMICIMHQATPYGYFLVNQKTPSRLTCSRLFGCTPDEYEGYLRELEEMGVFSKDDEGRIFSRRMIKDEYIRKVRRDAGLKGGNPNLTHKNLLNQMVNQHLNQRSKQNPTPSSSSSSSTSYKKIKDNKPLTPFELPDWVSVEDWNEYVEHRKDIKRPLTDKAKKLAIAELKKLKQNGEIIKNVIDQSILNGWAGLFPVRIDKNGEASNGARKKSSGEFVMDRSIKIINQLQNSKRTEKNINPREDSESFHDISRDISTEVEFSDTFE
jgi:hypothetical protein